MREEGGPDRPFAYEIDIYQNNQNTIDISAVRPNALSVWSSLFLLE
jgi:hypothetical protein